MDDGGCLPQKGAHFPRYEDSRPATEPGADARRLSLIFCDREGDDMGTVHAITTREVVTVTGAVDDFWRGAPG